MPKRRRSMDMDELSPTKKKQALGPRCGIPPAPTSIIAVAMGAGKEEIQDSILESPPPPGIKCANCNRALCNLATIQERSSESSQWICGLASNTDGGGQRVTDDKPIKKAREKKLSPCKNCLSPHEVFYCNKTIKKKKKKTKQGTSPKSQRRLSPSYRKRVDIQRRTPPVPWSFASPNSQKGMRQQLKKAQRMRQERASKDKPLPEEEKENDSENMKIHT
eukprot:scaffold858_cov123-Cylindrotheca_fusiformis.AAC.37